MNHRPNDEALKCGIRIGSVVEVVSGPAKGQRFAVAGFDFEGDPVAPRDTSGSARPASAYATMCKVVSQHGQFAEDRVLLEAFLKYLEGQGLSTRDREEVLDNFFNSDEFLST